MNTNDLPYEEQIEICDTVIAHYTQRKEALIMAHVNTCNAEARDAYEMTADPLVGRFLTLRGYDLPLTDGRFDRGAVAEAILKECSDEAEKAFGYACLAKEGSGPWVKFHAFCEGFYSWRDGHLDGGMA
jgi:hypothetical protein